MEQPTNPARRLHDVLYAVHSAQYSHGTVQAAWAKACDASSAPEIARTWLETVQLLDSWEILIKQNTTLDSARYLGLVDRIRTGMYSVGLWGQITDFRAHITSDLLTNLLFAADATGSQENVFEEASISDLLSQASELVEDIASSDLDADLKTVLIEGYEAVRFSLIHYAQFGADGLWDAFYKNLGIRMAHHRDIHGTNVGNQVDSMLGKVFDALQATTVRDVLKLGSTFGRLLGGGADGAGDIGC